MPKLSSVKRVLYDMGHNQDLMVDPGLIRERLSDVRHQIEKTARRCNRAPEEICLVAVGKTYPPEVLQAAIEAGVTDLGENRVQEAEGKITALGRHTVRWHLVGHLQANKSRRAVKLFDLIHSVDSIALAQRLNRLCVEESRDELPVLIQVELGQEETKSGVDEKDLNPLVDAVAECQRLRLSGLMTLPPFFDNPEDARPFFSRLRKIRDELAGKGVFQGRGELSMGMTHDFVVAIEEGATMVRIGTAIFGQRRQ